MSRLPPCPRLSWKEDGTPVDERVGDVYFSRHDGLEETRAVFLKGCGLPERWAGRRRFTIGELGFGTGLNFLAAWQAWRGTRSSQDAWLHFVSFEGYPLAREDAARALSAWPELVPLNQKLLDAWPERARGIQRLTWPEEGVSLTLHTGDIEEMLPGARLAADAWFLDGFSPAKNAEMWAASLWPLIHERCAPGAIAATFTVAGAVRRGLAEAGFEVEKKPGYGRKRERLEVRYRGKAAPRADTYGLRAPARAPDRVRVIGAGIAGACAARVLMDRGLAVEVVDVAPAPAQGASGNPLALVMPRLDAGDTVQARLMIDAYLAARAFYTGRAGVHVTQVAHRPKDAREAERISKVLADPPLGLENLEALAGGGQLHKNALIIEPETLIPQLLAGADVRYGHEVSPGDVQDGTPTIIANGHQVTDLLPWLGVEGRLGQVEYCLGRAKLPPSAIAMGDYSIALGTRRLWGASFEPWDGGTIGTHPDARARNMAALGRLAPDWRGDASDDSRIESRAAVRATTPDRLPLVGAVPDHDRVLEIFGGVRHGQDVLADAPLIEGLFISGGFGARGFTWAPWAGEVLAAQLLGEPAPASERALRAVSPMRQILRALKRGQV